LNHTLTLEQVEIWHGARRLLAIDVRIAAGEVLGVIGPSGAGKSTLLAHIAGFLDPAFRANGRVLLDDRDLGPVVPERRCIGLLFQDALLFPHLSVGGNLLFGLRRDVRDRRGRVADALASVGMAGFEKRDPATLSGGQKARVALLRLLLSEPSAVLLDEPFSKLDASLRSEIRALVFEHLRARKLAALLVSHDHSDALASDRVLELVDGGEARVPGAGFGI
jgi:putative thiamine transport system ATP-binding protein